MLPQLTSFMRLEFCKEMLAKWRTLSTYGHDEHLATE